MRRTPSTTPYGWIPAPFGGRLLALLGSIRGRSRACMLDKPHVLQGAQDAVDSPLRELQGSRDLRQPQPNRARREQPQGRGCSLNPRPHTHHQPTPRRRRAIRIRRPLQPALARTAPWHKLLPCDRSQNRAQPTPHASEDSTDSAASSTNISRSRDRDEFRAPTPDRSETWPRSTARPGKARPARALTSNRALPPTVEHVEASAACPARPSRLPPSC
jgi:hypothetical protein